MKRIIVACLLIVSMNCFAGSLEKYAVSFDCTEASNYVEKEICSNPALGQLDGLMAWTYKDRLAPQWRVDRSQLRQNQLAWLKERNKCTSESCIESEYKKRIAELCDIPVSGGVRTVSDCDRFIADNSVKVPAVAPGSNWVLVDSDDLSASYYDKNRVVRKNRIVAFYLMATALKKDARDPYPSSIIQTAIDCSDGTMVHGETDYYSLPYAKGDIVFREPHDENNQKIYSAFDDDTGIKAFNALCR